MKNKKIKKRREKKIYKIITNFFKTLDNDVLSHYSLRDSVISFLDLNEKKKQTLVLKRIAKAIKKQNKKGR